MDAGINNVICMELHLGPKMANSTCGKMIVAGTIDRGSTVHSVSFPFTSFTFSVEYCWVQYFWLSVESTHTISVSSLHYIKLFSSKQCIQCIAGSWAHFTNDTAYASANYGCSCTALFISPFLLHHHCKSGYSRRQFLLMLFFKLWI